MNTHAALLKEFLSRICEGDPEATRLDFKQWLRRRTQIPLAAGAVLLAGCGAGDEQGDGAGTLGGDSSQGGYAEGTAGVPEGGVSNGAGGQGGHGGATPAGGQANLGGSTAAGGALALGGATAFGQGGSSGALGGATGTALGGGSGSGEGGASGSGEGGASGSGEGGATGTALGGGSGSGEGGASVEGGSTGSGLGGFGGEGTLYGIPFELNCDDGIDNDFDDLIDCDDSDCIGTLGCGADYAIPIERCDDEVDNDGDEAVDCDDSDCADDAACTITLNLEPEALELCPVGTEVTLTLVNGTSERIFLPGCEHYTVDYGDGVKTPDVLCAVEGVARIVEPGGEFSASYRCPDRAGTATLCIQVNHGCTPELPLSQASCISEEWSCTPPFTLVPLP